MPLISWILAATDEGPMILNRHDFMVISDGERQLAYGVGLEFLSLGSASKDDLVRIKSVLDGLRHERGDGLVALDIGANIGGHTIAMARHMRGWGQVIAFEPQERVFYALCGNIALNNIGNAQAKWCAVGRRDEVIRMPVPNYEAIGSFGGLHLVEEKGAAGIGQPISYDPKDCTPVQVVTIDALPLDRVDFIKIDVEAMEMAVLAGACRTIERDRPVLWVEWVNVDRKALETWLSEADYSWETIGMNFLAEPET